jgi:recombination protein U
VARETRSERALKKSNHYYYKRGEAKVSKNDPHIRLFGKKAVFASSSGLDYSGVQKGGKHISFEVKETELLALPLSKIRMSQVDTMEKELGFGGVSFLLVLFKKKEEWYRLNFEQLKRLIDSPYGSIPLRFFRAFGYLIPSHLGFPEYLSPEAYPTSNLLKQDYPTWMPKPRPRRPVKPLPPIDHLDMDARKRRILNAMDRGCKNARRKEIEVERIKNRRGTDNNGTQGRYPFEDKC